MSFYPNGRATDGSEAPLSFELGMHEYSSLVDISLLSINSLYFSYHLWNDTEFRIKAGSPNSSTTRDKSKLIFTGSEASIAKLSIKSEKADKTDNASPYYVYIGTGANVFLDPASP